MYVLDLLSTDDINYTTMTLSVCMYVCMYVVGAGHDAWIAVNANEVGRSGGGLPTTSPSSSSSGSNTKATGKIEQVAISLTYMMMLLPMMTMCV